MPAEITTRDAVIRAMAAMEIAESCSHPEIRTRFEALAEDWLRHASETARDDRPAPSADGEALTL